MPNIFTYYMPTKVYFGDNSIQFLGEEARKLGSTVLFVTTNKARVARKTSYYDKILSMLKDQGLRVYEYIDVKHNPPIENVMDAVVKFQDKGIDLIIAFGGGSAIDAGKAIAVGLTLGDIRQYIYPRLVEEEIIPVIAIPTTCGTGSEVTRYSILTDTNTNRKVVVAGYPLIPKVAIVDPQTLNTLPSSLTAWTGFDALSHAIEAYMSKNSIPFIEPLALEAVKIVLGDIVEAYKGSMEAKSKLHLASTMAGIAINSAGTILVHALGYYLTTHHDIHHGLANAVYLPFVLKYNLEHMRRDKVSKLLESIELDSIEEFVMKLCKLLDETNIPSSLRDLGVKEDEIPLIVKETLSYKRNIENNPVPVNSDVVERIVKEAYLGRNTLCRSTTS